jgi:thiamine biosynthesis protein ThiS
MIRVNGDPMEWHEGMTVRDVLRKRNYIFRMLIVRIDGSLIPKQEFDTALVPDGSSVDVIHLISGG